jgi:mannose-6-phosphate isomerase-like protein (cupin superfamily)
MPGTNKLPLLPGAVGLTHLRVYDTPAPDGLRGGSPHVHLACTECYYIEKGHGRVQTLSAAGFQEFDLEPGQVVWFSPGVIHRLINGDGELAIFVVMQNNGLPEAGDFVLTMPAAILRDPDAYFEAASLSAHGEVFAGSVEAAYRRRDLAVEGFAALLQPKLAGWREIWRRGPAASAQATNSQITAMQQGDIAHLLRGAVGSLPPPVGERKLGMCGTLAAYLPEGATVAEEL